MSGEESMTLHNCMKCSAISHRECMRVAQRITNEASRSFDVECGKGIDDLEKEVAGFTSYQSFVKDIGAGGETNSSCMLHQ
jgi:hypothetical protein